MHNEDICNLDINHSPSQISQADLSRPFSLHLASQPGASKRSTQLNEPAAEATGILLPNYSGEFNTTSGFTFVLGFWFLGCLLLSHTAFCSPGDIDGLARNCTGPPRERRQSHRGRTACRVRARRRAEIALGGLGENRRPHP